MGRSLIFFNLFIFFKFIFGYVGSSLLHMGFLYLWRVGATLRCGVRLLIAVASLCCRAWALGSGASVVWLAGSRVQAQYLWRVGLVALRHVGSSQTRHQTRVPCIGRRILNHCAAREVLESIFIFFFK